MYTYYYVFKILIRDNVYFEDPCIPECFAGTGFEVLNRPKQKEKKTAET
jgi:hypothetical protein